MAVNRTARIMSVYVSARVIHERVPIVWRVSAREKPMAPLCETR
jgi:hypothetical protein